MCITVWESLHLLVLQVLGYLQGYGDYTWEQHSDKSLWLIVAVSNSFVGYNMYVYMIFDSFWYDVWSQAPFNLMGN